MWVKIPLTINSTEPAREINSAIYYAFQLYNFYSENRLEEKSAGAQQKALNRRLKALQKQVIFGRQMSGISFW